MLIKICNNNLSKQKKCHNKSYSKHNNNTTELKPTNLSSQWSKQILILLVQSDRNPEKDKTAQIILLN